MFSYRHSYHAGNHADVLKHLCQTLLLDKLTSKDKPFVYVDTHSGAGKYALDSEEAQKNQEYHSGISLVNRYEGDNPAIQSYLKLMHGYLEKGWYPGSPEIANAMVRPADKVILMEFHNREVENLRRNMRNSSAAVHHRDGFEGLIALCPPKPARGMVLIDPPYEQESEYGQVCDTLKKALTRWQTGIYAVWYPLLSKRAGKKHGKSEQMLQKLGALPVKNLLDVQLTVTGADGDMGMYGSGMAIINAPWQLDVQIEQALTELGPLMAMDTGSRYDVNWLVEE